MVSCQTYGIYNSYSLNDVMMQLPVHQHVLYISPQTFNSYLFFSKKYSMILAEKMAFYHVVKIFSLVKPTAF